MYPANDLMRDIEPLLAIIRPSPSWFLHKFERVPYFPATGRVALKSAAFFETFIAVSSAQK